MGAPHGRTSSPAEPGVSGGSAMNDDRAREAVARLSRIPGVTGAMLVDLAAGVPILAELAEQVNGTAVAALTASLYKRADSAAEATSHGRLSTVQLDSVDGHVIIAGAGDVAIALTATAGAQLG